MKTGIIGAGRVGCSLGKYFRSKNADLVGYYDTNAAAAEEAAAGADAPAGTSEAALEPAGDPAPLAKSISITFKSSNV